MSLALARLIKSAVYRLLVPAALMNEVARPSAKARTVTINETIISVIATQASTLTAGLLGGGGGPYWFGPVVPGISTNIKDRIRVATGTKCSKSIHADQLRSCRRCALILMLMTK